jgi:hypothetical protein
MQNTKKMHKCTPYSLGRKAVWPSTIFPIHPVSSLGYILHTQYTSWMINE